MALKATTLVTIEQARQWVHSDPDASGEDTMLEICADAASERLERRTSRVFRLRTVSETHSGDGFGSVLYLSRFPIVSLTSLTVDGQALTADRYVVDHARGRVLLTGGGRFPAGAENVTVVYQAGYADEDLPSDAIELCLELTKRLYHLKTKGGQSFEVVTMGDGRSAVMRDDIPRDLRDAVDALKDTRFG